MLQLLASSRQTHRNRTSIDIRHVSMAYSKKRKVDSKYRIFKDEWTEKYTFILPMTSTKTMCLTCSESVALVKSANVKRHYDTKHSHFDQTQNTELRTRKINQIKAQYEKSTKVFVIP